MRVPCRRLIVPDVPECRSDLSKVERAQTHTGRLRSEKTAGLTAVTDSIKGEA